MKWSSSPPGTVVDVDPCSPDVDLLQQAWVDEQARPRVRAVKVLGSRFGTLYSPAWVVAWARPAGAHEWRWVLLMWQDKPVEPLGPHLWRWEWLEPDKALIRPLTGDERAPRDDHDFAAALVEAITSLGHGGPGQGARI